jgi:hypothetical protein
LPESDLWQFRFVRKIGGVPLAVSTELVSRRCIKFSGLWSDALGKDEKGYCEFTRNITIDGRHRCLSRLYACVSRLPKIMKIAESKFRGNLKTVFAEEFDAPILTLDQNVEPSKFDSEIARCWDCRPGRSASPCMRPDAASARRRSRSSRCGCQQVITCWKSPPGETAPEAAKKNSYPHAGFATSVHLRWRP